jgi:hypothetical protein
VATNNAQIQSENEKFLLAPSAAAQRALRLICESVATNNAPIQFENE